MINKGIESGKNFIVVNNMRHKSMIFWGY